MSVFVYHGSAGGLEDGDAGDIVISGDGTTLTIDNNAVTDAKLRDSAALSVIGRSANSTGDPADITAGSDGLVLRRSGTTLGFGEVATAGLANNAVTYAKMQTLSTANRLLGGTSAGTITEQEHYNQYGIGSVNARLAGSDNLLTGASLGGFYRAGIGGAGNPNAADEWAAFQMPYLADNRGQILLPMTGEDINTELWFRVLDSGVWGRNLVAARPTLYGLSYEPGIQPTLDLDFVRSRFRRYRVDNGYLVAEDVGDVLTFTRSTTGGLVGPTGLLRTASSGEPRVSYVPSTGASVGLIVSPQRTNLALRSEEFNNAAWVAVRASVTANTSTAPDGATTADKLVEDSSNDTHYIQSTISSTSGTAYTLSLFAKAAERSAVELRFLAATHGSNQAAAFNLATGASSLVAGSPTFGSVALPNGWYRVWITATASATASSVFWIRLNETFGGAVSYPGNGTNGVLLWGAQLEAASQLSAYIPTTSSSVTRNADTLAWAVGDGFTAREGTFLIAAQTRSGDSLIRWDSTNVLTAPDANNNRIAISYDQTETRTSVNGNAVTTASAPPSSVTNVNFLDGALGNVTLIRYYPKKLSNTLLRRMSYGP